MTRAKPIVQTPKVQTQSIDTLSSDLIKCSDADEIKSSSQILLREKYVFNADDSPAELRKHLESNGFVYTIPQPKTISVDGDYHIGKCGYRIQLTADYTTKTAKVSQVESVMFVSPVKIDVQIIWKRSK